MKGIEIGLPAWMPEMLESLPEFLSDLNERMHVVIECSRRNVMYQSGGPFAAGVFENRSGRLVSLGVNRVVPANCSAAHAEIVALSLAQQQLGTFDLGGPDCEEHQLVVSGRPCAMCFGAILWSGVRSLAFAASGSQIEELTGFDEGPLPKNWKRELEKRGIEVLEGIQQDAACEVLRTFVTGGGLVYNARAR